jgi:hypothetical protein
MKTTSRNILVVLVPALLLVAPQVRGDEAAAKPESEDVIAVTPIISYADVSGDSDRFRHDWWTEEDVTGGIDALAIQRSLGGDWKLSLEGRAIFDVNDYKLQLEIVNPEVGFLRAGYKAFRKYYDNSGGFYNFTTAGPTLLSSGRDLSLDIGSFYVELGLTLPNWPAIVLGYERMYKDGEKSMIEWGTVTESPFSRNINAAVKEINEQVDIFKLSIDHDISNVHVGDQFRYEKYNYDNVREDDTALTLPNTAPGKSVVVNENYQHGAFYNTFHMESHVSEKVYWSAGYFFTSLKGEPDFAVDTIIDAANGGTSSGSDKFWNLRDASIDQESHVLNLNVMYGPCAKTYAYAGIQAEQTESDAFADADWNETSAPTEAALINTRNDKDWFEERVGIRCIAIPFTTLYAEGKWQQGSVGLFEEELITGADPAIRSELEQRYTDTDVDRQEYRIGFNTAPIRRVNLSGYYRRYEGDNRYNNLIDQIIVDDGSTLEAEPQDGYSAFIDHQEFDTHEFGAKLTVRPSSKVNISFKYQFVDTDIATEFEDPAASGQSGNYDANIYSVAATVLPVSRMYCTALFSYQDTRTIGTANGAAAVPRYEGNVYSIVGALGYALDEKTDVRAEYSYSHSDNFVDVSADGLPLGLDYQRHAVSVSVSRELADNIVARLRYGYYELDEDSTGGFNDYIAHLISGAVTLRY